MLRRRVRDSARGCLARPATSGPAGAGRHASGRSRCSSLALAATGCGRPQPSSTRERPGRAGLESARGRSAPTARAPSARSCSSRPSASARPTRRSTSRSAWPARAAASSASAPARPTSPTRRGRSSPRRPRPARRRASPTARSRSRTTASRSSSTRDNTWVSCLTVAQLAKIWGEKSKVGNWRDLDPAFPDVPMRLYGPGTDSGTFDFFTAQINGEEDVSRSDYSASEDDNVTVQGVGGDRGALGYFGLSYAEENASLVKLLAVDGGRRLRQAEHEDGAGRHVHAALAPALRLRQAPLGAAARGEGVPRLPRHATPARSPSRRALRAAHALAARRRP